MGTQNTAAAGGLKTRSGVNYPLFPSVGRQGIKRI